MDAGLRVLAARGLRGLTHRAVDHEAGMPEGSTSNDFRTRQALIAALATHVATRRLAADHPAADQPDADRTVADQTATGRTVRSSSDTTRTDDTVSRAWFELLIEAGRNQDIAEAIRPMRERMIAALGAARTDSLPLTDRQLAALLTGMEFAEYATGENVTADVLALLERRADPNPQGFVFGTSGSDSWSSR